MVLFFAVFLLAGAGFTYVILIGPLIRTMRAQGWTQVPCEVVSSQVRSHRSRDGRTYSIEVVYRYVIGGRVYSSKRYNFVSGASSGYKGKAAVVREHPPGKRTVCFVNPDDPTDAVIDRGLQGEMAFGLLPLIFVAVGAGGIYWVLRGNSAKAAAPLTARRPSPLVGPAVQTAPLKTRSSRLGAFIGLTLFGLFWNGIVSIFVVQIVQGWLRGSPNWFLTIFAIPFVAVGLLVLWGAIYQLLAVFNPATELVVRSETPRLGETVKLTWRLSGKVHRVQRLQLVVEGREEATYRRGTNTHTDRAVFYRETLADTRSPSEILGGTAEFKIPADTMHSFTAANNKIVWSVTIRGDVPRWPDLKDEYPLIVSPLEINRANA